MVKKIGKYELGKTLGEGRFGKVKFGINTETGEQVAIKILVKSKVLEMKAVERVKREIAIMKKISHANVVTLVEVMSSPEKIYIVMELLNGGELFYKLATVRKFSEPVARRYFLQLIKALDYCHSLGVFHRDLKPENLLLDDKDNLKISDFGLSALFDISSNDSFCHTLCGTPNYVAPEVLQSTKIGYDPGKADVWSCGIILHVLLTGRLPFDEPNDEALYAKIIKAQFKMPSDISKDAAHLMSRILDPNPHTRITMAGIEAHPWCMAGNLRALDWSEILIDAAAKEGSPPVDGGEDGPLIRQAEVQSDTQLSLAGRTITNAFELIALSGALDLTRLLQGKALSTRQTCTRFCTNVPVITLVKRLQEALKGFPYTTQVNSKSLTVQVTGCTRNGMLRYTVQILHITPHWHLVDFRRDKGNILEFNDFYRVTHERCKDIVFVRMGTSRRDGDRSDSPEPEKGRGSQASTPAASSPPELGIAVSSPKNNSGIASSKSPPNSLSTSPPHVGYIEVGTARPTRKDRQKPPKTPKRKKKGLRAMHVPDSPTSEDRGD